MKFVFQKQLDQELLHSERKRAIILIIIFSAAMAFRIINYFIFTVDEETVHMESFMTIWLFPVTIILFELFCLLHINKRIKANKKGIPLVAQYLNTAFEICLPSFIILFVARQYPSYNVLNSPAVLIYFIFIILSTLRLNFSLSVLCGVLSCSSYAVFSTCLYGHFNTNDAARAFILLFSGIASGLVAKQIRSGINNSLQETERRHKVENLFAQQISVEVAEKMLENDGAIESKRMQVAVMFIDIRNFTLFASGKSPEEIVQYQNSFFKIVIESVTKYDGIVNQLLGDGCMITFGAPLVLENPSSNAVNAALEVLKRLETEIKKGSIVSTKVGIGIHTGEAVTGNIGTSTRQQYSITGHVVIIASRIEQLNKELQSQILVSEEVIRKVDNKKIKAEFFPEVSLKGFEKPVSIYKVA